MGAAPVKKPSAQCNTGNYDMLVEKKESSVDNADPSDISQTEVRKHEFNQLIIEYLRCHHYELFLNNVKMKELNNVIATSTNFAS